MPDNSEHTPRLIDATANIALGPVAGPLGRTALGGRTWEGFAVDPYLSGVLSAETIKGMQDAGVIANLKVGKCLLDHQIQSLIARYSASCCQ